MAVFTELKEKFSEMTTRKGDLESELDKLRKDLANTQAALSLAYLERRPTATLETKVAKLQGREAAIMGALDMSDTTLSQEGEKLAEAELEADREGLDQLEKELDKEAVRLVKQAYSLWDQANKAHLKAWDAERKVNRNREHLTFAKIRPSAAVFSSILRGLESALIALEMADKEWAKRAKHKLVRPGFK